MCDLLLCFCMRNCVQLNTMPIKKKSQLYQYPSACVLICMYTHIDLHKHRVPCYFIYFVSIYILCIHSHMHTCTHTQHMHACTIHTQCPYLCSHTHTHTQLTTNFMQPKSVCVVGKCEFIISNSCFV